MKKRILATLAAIWIVAAVVSLAQGPKYPVLPVGGAADPNTVTAAGTLTSNLPVIGGGSKAVAVGTRSGNTTAYVTTTGTQTSGRCVEIDANGNHIAAAAGCGVADTNGMVLLETCTISTSASCDFASTISALFDLYQIELVSVTPATNATRLFWRASTDGSNYDSGNNYGTADFRSIASTTGVGGAGATSAIIFPSTTELSNASTDSISITLKLRNPASATKRKILTGSDGFFLGTGGLQVNVTVGGAYLSATPITAFQIKAETGDLASGIIRTYGIAK